MEAGESAAEACIREVWEETGLKVEVKRLIGVYSNPNQLVVYADGNNSDTFVNLPSFCPLCFGGLFHGDVDIFS